MARGRRIGNVLTTGVRTVQAADALSVLVGAVAVSASWLAYGRSDLSLDEGYTSAETRLPLGTLLQVLWSRELNGSLHTLLMWLLDRPAPLVMRLPSALFMVAALFLAHHLVRRHFGSWPACAALAVLVLNPAIQQDLVIGRTYALTLFLIVLSFGLLDRAVQARRAAPFLLWGCVSGLMLYAHFVTGLVVAAQALWLFKYEWSQRKCWSVGVAVVAICAIPIAVFLAGDGGHQGQLISARQPTLMGLVSGVLDVTSGYVRVNRTIGLGVVLLIGAVVTAAVVRRPHRMALLGVLTFALPVVGLAVGAQVTPALFNERYLVLSLPGLALAVGAGAARCGEWSTWLSRVSVTLLVWCNTVACWVVLTSTIGAPWISSHPWSAAMQYIGAGSSVTTALPAEGYLAGMYALRYGAQFRPASVPSAQEFLEQSGYGRRRCLDLELVTGPLWVMSSASTDFEADVEKLATCLHARPTHRSTFGAVQVVLLVPVS